MAGFGGLSPFSSKWSGLGTDKQSKLEQAGISEKTWNKWNSAAQTSNAKSAQNDAKIIEGQSSLGAKLTKNLHLWTDIISAQSQENKQLATQNA